MVDPSNTPRGLSSVEARARLARDGPNALPRGEGRTAIRIVVDVLAEPMLAMLLGAGLIYLALGDRTEAAILLAFACFSILITIVQEARTERVLDALRDLSAPQAVVVRDGIATRIAGREVVEGDIVLLEQGDRVAADGLLIEAREMEADESLLTGEAFPVRKRPAGQADDAGDDEPGGDERPHVFAGTVITRGRGMAAVTRTGSRSRTGRIGASIAALETDAPRLRRETGRIVRIAAVAGLGMAATVAILSGLTSGRWLEALLAGIAVAMSLLPEEFPVVLAIFLAMGSWRIARAGVLTRRAAAIETMGAATVLCTDKTGTLTENRMQVAAVWSASTGIRRIDDPVSIGDYGDLLRAAALASAPVPVDPMEVAFHDAARATGWPGRDNSGLVHSHGVTPELLAMSNIWRGEDEGGTHHLVAAKGAPEAIAQLCRLEPPASTALAQAALAMAAAGMRVLGVAQGAVAPGAIAPAQSDYDFSLLGLVGLSDPLRPGVADAVAQCRSAGLRVVMITGDHAATACAIAEQAGLESGAVMTGADIASLSDEALAARLQTVSVFARIMPEQKLRIVKAFKRAGEIVAMTGDGVNDAPALKAADIGVAMGRRGTDVAREAAAIVLVEDDFSAIVAAIRVGRRIFDNIRKAMSFILAVHVPIGGLAVLPLLMDRPLVLGPVQIALLEMIIDPICALMFEAEPEERRIMQRPPRDAAERLLSTPVLGRGLALGGVALLVLAALYVGLALAGCEQEVLRTVVFAALVTAILALVLANRTFDASIRAELGRGNPMFRIIAATIFALGVLIMMAPSLREALGFARLDWRALALLPFFGLALLILFNLIKRRLLAARFPR